MTKSKAWAAGMVLIVASFAGAAAQEADPQIHVVVNMVQLNVAVTDNKGNYITGLRPQDFIITEDQIPENIATFGEGNQPIRKVTDLPAADEKSPAGESADPSNRSASATGPASLSSLVAGANVFVLFDTSNCLLYTSPSPRD